MVLVSRDRRRLLAGGGGSHTPIAQVQEDHDAGDHEQTPVELPGHAGQLARQAGRRAEDIGGDRRDQSEEPDRRHEQLSRRVRGQAITKRPLTTPIDGLASYFPSA